MEREQWNEINKRASFFISQGGPELENAPNRGATYSFIIQDNHACHLHSLVSDRGTRINELPNEAEQYQVRVNQNFLLYSKYIGIPYPYTV